MDMKKLLCAVLSGAMVMSFAAVSAFAATSSLGIAYDNDGDPNGDFYGSSTRNTGWRGLDSGAPSSLQIDGVAPGATLYIPIAANMTSNVNSTFGDISLEELCNDDYFKFDVDKDDNGKMVKKISVYDNKKLGDFTNRTSYLKIELADSTTTEDIKSTGTISFKARNSAANFKNASGSKKLTRSAANWNSGDEIKFDYTFWINNEKKTNDDNPDTGDRVYFDPDKNDTNTMIWGDDRASLKFESDDDPGKFYARLSTKTDNEIYTTYGDPVDADLWFYDFVGNPTVPSTSKATLTLGIPWDDDDDYIPDPTQCFIYERDADGYLVDVTDKFTYSEDDEEIDGWSIKTRTLGTYIVSDTELDVDSYDTNDEPVASSEAPVSSAPTTDGGKVIPNTGSSDMVNVAVVAAVVSLAAAGAVAFRKVK